MNAFFANAAELVSALWMEVAMFLLASIIYLAATSGAKVKSRSKAAKAQPAKASNTSPQTVRRQPEQQPYRPRTQEFRKGPSGNSAPRSAPAVVAKPAAKPFGNTLAAAQDPSFAFKTKQEQTFATPSFVSKIKSLAQVRDVAGIWKAWQEMKNYHGKVNAVALGCMVDALVYNRQSDDAWKLVQQLWEDPEQRGAVNTVTYSTLLKGFAASRESAKVMEVYKEMSDKNISCNIITYNTVLNAFAQCSAMHLAPQIWQDMSAANPPVAPDLVTYSTLVKGYASSGDLKRALEIFEELKKDPTKVPDEVLYNSLLDGCARERRVREAMSLMEDMKKSGVTPSNYTLTIMVKLLGRSKMLKEAYALVDTVRDTYGVKPNVQVYTCLITACFQCRQTKKAVALLDRMLEEGLQPDEKAYDVIVRGCRQAGQTALAEDVERKAAAAKFSGFSKAPQTASRPAPAPWRRELKGAEKKSGADSNCSTDCSSGSDSSGESDTSSPRR